VLTSSYSAYASIILLDYLTIYVADWGPTAIAFAQFGLVVCVFCGCSAVGEGGLTCFICMTILVASCCGMVAMGNMTDNVRIDKGLTYYNISTLSPASSVPDFGTIFFTPGTFVGAGEKEYFYYRRSSRNSVYICAAPLVFSDHQKESCFFAVDSSANKVMGIDGCERPSCPRDGRILKAHHYDWTGVSGVSQMYRQVAAATSIQPCRDVAFVKLSCDADSIDDDKPVWTWIVGGYVGLLALICCCLGVCLRRHYSGGVDCEERVGLRNEARLETQAIGYPEVHMSDPSDYSTIPVQPTASFDNGVEYQEPPTYFGSESAPPPPPAPSAPPLPSYEESLCDRGYNY